ncbi:MAG: KUP/HAK/KT family potassium transporter [Solirubrobacteraceae bacterium]
MFLGDGMITPAITVTSAMEGLKVATPGMAHLVVPISREDPLSGSAALRCLGRGARPTPPRPGPTSPHLQ